MRTENTGQNTENTGQITENTVVKRLIWSGLMAGIGVVSSIVANRVATAIWLKVFDEDPPFDD